MSKLLTKDMSKLENKLKSGNLELSNLSEKQKEYVRLASKMPYDEINERIKQYEASNPKQDQLKMISELSNLYGCDKKDVVKRIQQVLKISIYQEIQTGRK